MAERRPEFTHRVVWAHGDGYWAQQFVMGSGWLDLGYPGRRTHAEAALDCKLDGGHTNRHVKIDPQVQHPAQEWYEEYRLESFWD